MDKKFIVLFAVILIFLGVGWYLYTPPTKSLPTYFTYTPTELARISKMSTKNVITIEDLNTWQARAFTLVVDTKTIDVGASKFYAALFTAQRDVAYLSYNLTGTFSGSIDPVSKTVSCMFFPNDCASLSAVSDPYSEALAALVVSKLKVHLENDVPQPDLYPIKEGMEYWHSNDPYIGYGTGGQRPWFLKEGKQFRVIPPPPYGSEEDLSALSEVKTTLDQITSEQRKAVVFWAGGPGTKTPPGQWIEIASEYMTERNTSLAVALDVRSTLAMSIADAVIAVFDSKWTYLRLRPFMRDASIITVMPTPTHPSYPSGHGTISGAASTILTHFFPENADEWRARAKEAADSRFWGGIHYDLDNAVGLDLGEKVANTAFADPRLMR